jgi:hypothetical protein
MHQHLVVDAASHDEKAAVGRAGQRRQRRRRETVEGAPGAAGFQVLPAGNADDVVGANGVHAGELAGERLGAHRKAVETEQSREAAESSLTALSALG